MMDVSFRAPSSSKDSGDKSRHASVIRQRDVTVLRRKSLMDSTSSESGAEASTAVGTKRTRGRLDEPEGPKYSSLAPSGVCFDLDPMSTIVIGAKRVRIVDSAGENRDSEWHQSLFVEKNHREKQEPVPQTAIKHTGVLVIPARASLAGLPEELIIDVLTELGVGDVISLRRTNKRLANVTRARVIWIKRLCQLLHHLQIAQGPATQVPTRDLEHAVIRPYIFDYKWLRSRACHERPMASKVLSTGWSEAGDIRFPMLMPGGRWLLAACDHPRSPTSAVCIWDLHDGTQPPDAQMIAEGRIISMDVKMDRKGTFGILAVLSEKDNFTPPAPVALLGRVDVYAVIFATDKDASKFRRMDTFLLGRQQGSEVQIYPERGRVIVDLFDRVLFWDYKPVNMCALMRTARRRRDHHEAAHAFTHTHKYLIIADGDGSELIVFKLPPLLILHTLPSFALSLRFSTNRLVDISTIPDDSAPAPPAADEAPAQGGIFMPQLDIHGDEVDPCSEPSERGLLFIDAASCDSYLLCSFPTHELSSNAGSVDNFCFTSMDRGDAQEQARSGARDLSGTRSKSAKANALWVGAIGGIPSAMDRDSGGSSPRSEAQNVVLMRNPDHDASLIVLSATIPAAVDLGPGQSRITDIEQGAAKTVLPMPVAGSVDASHGGPAAVRVEGASVDEISGRVCLVETATFMDSVAGRPPTRSWLRLLEYA
ncbi:hypothetical protein JB92DRAFT_2904320 [Gautieria morchelliformis]|nr:hypothetical protein JB92DRAFT_2904320 [Gautieria morchelliformis]